MKMKNLETILYHFFTKTTGYSYINLGRLFLRLFVGVMFIQFGIRQLVNYNDLSQTFPAVLGMSSSACLVMMITIELVCSLFIMVGFITRLSTLPPIVSMILAEYYILHDIVPHASIYGLASTQPGYLPIMFIGIFLFFLIAGPGKISVDYCISVFIINRHEKDENAELEDV